MPPGEKENHRLKSALVGDMLVPRRVSVLTSYCNSILSTRLMMDVDIIFFPSYPFPSKK